MGSNLRLFVLFWVQYQPKMNFLQLAWLIELGAMVLTCFACLAAYPVAVPVIVPLWILRTCVYYAVCHVTM
jgi:hypothetical protein